MTILRMDDVGAAVGALQRRLVINGYKLEETNVFDAPTHAAVVQLQVRAGLVVDGRFGEKSDTYLRGSETGYYLKQSDLVQAAEKLGVDLASVMAVNEVESTGSGFISDGVPKILFERHVFWRRLKAHGIDPQPLSVKFPGIVSQKRGGYAGGKSEYTRLNAAMSIHREAALEAASWGAFQVMGYHWEMLGYSSVEEFVEKMREDEGQHLDAFVRYILSDKTLHKALQTKKWATVARLYNGPAYEENLYDVKMERAYKRYSEQLKVAA